MALSLKLAERGDDDIEERFGFVLMLDGLGVSALDQKGQWEWLKRRNEMIRHLDEQQQFHLGRHGQIVRDALDAASRGGMPRDVIARMETGFEIYKEIHDSSSFATFGDTVILHAGISRKHISPENDFTFIAQTVFSLHEVMKANLKFDLRLRGSVALGEFLIASKSDTIMGDALLDAYRSYEKADWIGIVVAPGRTEETINDAFGVMVDVVKQHGLHVLAFRRDWWNLGISHRQTMALAIHSAMVKFPVWYKEEDVYKQREMWTPVWPLTVHLNRIIPEEISNIPLSDKVLADAALSAIHSAKASSENSRHWKKYDNTEQYYNYIWTQRCSFLENVMHEHFS